MKTDYTYYPNFSEAESDEIYSGRLSTEYIQCIDEGLDAEGYRDLFLSIEKMPCSHLKEEFADTAYKLVSQLKIRADYKYTEPSDAVGISELSDKFIKHPLDVVSVGQIVTVWVVSVDLRKNRLELTMIDPSKK